MPSLSRHILRACIFLSCLTSQAIAATVNLNGDWHFHRDDKKAIATSGDVPAAGWTRVNLPHTARIEAREPVDTWQGQAFYKKIFEVKLHAGERAVLRFEGAMNVADVWVNGKHLGQHLGGYLPFSFDVSDVLTASGQNELTVRINNEDNKITGPKPLKDLDYIQYGGLYRGVSLTIKPPVHITDEMLSATPAGGGIFVTYPTADKAAAVVRVKTEVHNTEAVKRDIVLRHAIFKKGGRVGMVVERVALAAGERRHVELDLKLARPSLWSPAAPNLYELKTSVESAGRRDEVSTQIGIRRIAFDARQRLLLNGEPLFLRGVNRHQEYPYVGYATSPQADYRDALLIKKAGYDYVRLSHYPHSPAFMRAADELGLLLLDAIPGWQYFNADPAFARQTVQTCADMIRRDRNHPSVLAWECSLNETDMPQPLIDQLHRTVHLEYPGDQAFSAGWVPQTYDIYLQARQHRIGSKHKLPVKPLIVSEYGDWEYFAMNAGFNQTAWADLKEADRSSRQFLGDGEKRLQQQAKNVAEAHDDNFTTPAFADGYWVMFDYARGYAKELESSGIMSIDRLPKFAYDFARSQRSARETSPLWGGGPMVAIASHWNSDSSPLVRVFTNADELEFFVNGKSIGRQKSAASPAHPNLKHPPLEFDTGRFAPGELKAVAYLDGKQVATHSVHTASAPASLHVWLDDMGVKPVAGDLVFVRAQLRDASGNPVAASGKKVEFAASGGFEIVGAMASSTESGVASVLVRVGAAGGAVKAQAAGLKGEFVERLAPTRRLGK
ncbi:MAG: glycoside hydrolase family 2 TIM barrel-domain containing protein [Pseudomonadota bacterium]